MQVYTALNVNLEQYLNSLMAQAVDDIVRHFRKGHRAG